MSNVPPPSLSQENASTADTSNSWVTRISTPFTQCFGFVAESPAVVRATEIGTPYFETVSRKFWECVAAVRGQALAEPLIDSDDDNYTQAPPDMNMSQSYMSQSAMAGSIFNPPTFPPTIAQQSMMQKSYNEYQPPNLSMESSLRKPDQ